MILCGFYMFVLQIDHLGYWTSKAWIAILWNPDLMYWDLFQEILDRGIQGERGQGVALNLFANDGKVITSNMARSATSCLMPRAPGDWLIFARKKQTGLLPSI